MMGTNGINISIAFSIKEYLVTLMDDQPLFDYIHRPQTSNSLLIFGKLAVTLLC